MSNRGSVTSFSRACRGRATKQRTSEPRGVIWWNLVGVNLDSVSEIGVS